MSELISQIWTPQMQMAFTVLMLILVCIWILSIVWVARDARLRGQQPVLWMIVALIPGLGIIAYLLMRPPMLAMDRDEQELEVALKQRELMKYGECAQCGYPVRDDYVICPNCQTRLRNMCHRCGKPLEPSWKVCPYCATPASGAAAPQRSTSAGASSPRRRSHAAASQDASAASQHTTQL